MKKFKYIVTAVLFVSIFSEVFAFAPYRIEPLDVRTEGMGGAYLTDSESFYTLFSNPAGLAFVGKKTLYPTFVSINGVIPESEKWSTDGSKYPSHKVVVFAPLTFGAIKNNFGWGVLNTLLLAEGIVEGIALGTDLAVVFGYSLPIDLDFFGKLSIGISGRGIVQVKSDYLPLFVQLFASTYSIATSTTLGFGFDVGIQYEVLNVLNIALVLQDAYTAVWTKNFLRDRDNATGETVSHETPFKYAQLEPKLSIGVGFDIPVEKITDTVSHLGIHIDYNNLWPLLKKDRLPFCRCECLLSTSIKFEDEKDKQKQMQKASEQERERERETTGGRCTERLRDT